MPQSPPKFLCSLPHNEQGKYLIIRQNGEATLVVSACRASHFNDYVGSISCYSLHTGACCWSRPIPKGYKFRFDIKLRDFPALKSIVITTERDFSIVSYTGELVSHPQPIVVDGVFRAISDVTVHNDTVIVGLPDGRICCYTPAMLSLVELCARQIIMSKTTRQINELCKRVPSDIVVRLEEAYYQYKKN